ncbi:MAG: response regulator transcription factor [Phycisphaeraceae bacterium]|nr:response regulator transcription factor [Phycisphaeraceae bacterium]
MSQSTEITAKARKREGTPVGDCTVMVVEDEPDLQDLLRYNLNRQGYKVVCADSAEQGLKQIQRQPPNLIVLDLMLPGMDGLEFCRLLRKDPQTANLPVLILTAKGEEADIVTGLDTGADDYLAKPFSPRVMLARVKALLRRGQTATEGDSGSQSNLISVKAMAIDSDKHEVRVAGRRVDLTATEFKMLWLLASKPGRVFTRQQIITAIHGQYAAVTDRSVDVQIVTLRRKLGEHGSDVETVRGVGYRFRESGD